jgi:uncharacterized protein with HEPN domain
MTPRCDPRAYVGNILEAIANIEADTGGLDFDQFAADRRVRLLVERNVEIISEASRRLPDDARAAEPDVPWHDIAGIGNILRHDYGSVRPDPHPRRFASRPLPRKGGRGVCRSGQPEPL